MRQNYCKYCNIKHILNQPQEPQNIVAAEWWKTVRAILHYHSKPTNHRLHNRFFTTCTSPIQQKCVTLQHKQNLQDSERNIHNTVAHRIEHPDDIRMVRQPVAAPAPHKRLVAYAAGRAPLVARGRIGILLPHPSQLDRLRHQRRALLAHATESDTRGYLDKRIHRHCHDVLPGATPALEPHSSIPMPRRSRLLRVLEVEKTSQTRNTSRTSQTRNTSHTRNTSRTSHTRNTSHTNKQ